MFVRVHRVESCRDSDGELAKRIELVEDLDGNVSRAMRPRTEEARMVQDVIQALQQQFLMFPSGAAQVIPKIVLFLSEKEYDSLGVTFNVNQVFEVRMERASLKFIEEARE